MAKGTVCIIGCPILEDEIVYSLCNDKDEKNVFIVDTEPAHTLKKKLTTKGIPFTLLDEWEFDKGFCEMDENDLNIVVIMNKLGLHSEPDVLRKTLEDQLKQYQNRVDAVAVYYGMCGNACWDISKFASSSVDVPAFVFRDANEDVCDDCIGVALGGHQKYYSFVKKYPGMLYVTPAIAENWDGFSKEMDMCKGFEILDIHSLKGVFELFGYKKAVKIDTGIGTGGDAFEKGCARVSEATGLELVTPPDGSVDLYPTERIYRDAKAALRP
ncbi:MAG: DUF1638 domain-containing protein [Methanomassiliicoccaceae archaeon]|nr:DUF1638 domain-containing protein [Methanomassiliicoccaceae archaeon]